MEDYQKLAKDNIEVWMPYIRFKNGKGPSLTTFIYVSNLGNVKGYLYNNRPFTKEMIKINGDGRRCVGCKSIYIFVWELFVDVAPEGFVIHHTDFNKLNDRLDNLVCISKAEHNTIHWKGKHTKGSEIMNQKNKGSVWYNDGNKNKRFKAEIEAFAFGYFNKGRLCSPNKGRKFSETARKNMSNAAKKRYNNEQ